MLLHQTYTDLVVRLSGVHAVLNSQTEISIPSSIRSAYLGAKSPTSFIEPLSNGISYKIRAEMWISIVFQVQSLKRNLLFQTNSIFLFPFHIREKKIGFINYI